MSTPSYELLKCDHCGKILGYVRIDVKVYPPKSLIRLATGGPLIKVEKHVLCHECFQHPQ